jgi:L-rhamnose-H+ transport protein
MVAGTLWGILHSNGADWIITGIVGGALGIALCGVAGRSKEKDMAKASGNKGGFSLAKGLPLCLLAGVLSAFYGFAINAAAPVVEVAAQYGAGNYKTNVVYLFSNTGAFAFTLLYCGYLHVKQKTFKEYIQVPQGLRVNYLMAALTGLLWYGQFFFYGLGHVRLGKYEFSSWAIHMIMLVLFSTLTGIALKEWKMCSVKTWRLLVLALIILVASVLMLTRGNYLGGL